VLSFSGIEKAVRDLQRCAVSFGRYKTLLNDEINDSYKRIKQVSLSTLGIIFYCFVEESFVCSI